jgi:non-heme chloroperoxidase
MNKSAGGNEKYIEVEPGVKLHITDKGSGRPVVLLPGLPLSDMIFKYTFDMLSENGYRAVGITMRGFGKFESFENHDLELHASDVHRVLNILQLKDAILCGYTFGGVVAAYYLSRYNSSRISKLALISSNVPLYTRLGRYPHGLSINDLNKAISTLEKDQGTIDDVFGPVHQPFEESSFLPTGNWLNNIPSETTEKGFTQESPLRRAAELRPLLSSIKIPTLIMHAKDDTLIPFGIALQAHAGIENSQLVVFETGGQWYFLLKHERFNNELLAFAEQ